MVEITKDFIILIATLIVVLTILSVIFSEKGVLSSVFAFKTYAEPLTLLDHLSATITTASSCPGECSISFKTSGMPYIIEIYKEDGKYYASIDFKLVEQKTNVKFEGIEPKPLISDCVILEQKLFLIEGIIQDITVKKTIEDGSCRIFIESIKGEYDFNVSVFPSSGFVLNGSSLTVTVTVSLVGGKIAPGPVRLSTSGEPPGVSIIFSKNNLDPTFTSKMIVYADQTARAGTYQIIITGTSGSLARWTTFELEVSPLHYTFVLDSKIDIINLPLTGVKVNVNGDIRYTRKHDEFTSNIVYGLSKGIYDVSVEDPFDLRPFSHFRDYDCDGLGNVSDTADNPHSFNITNKNRDMTAYYKVFTQIRNLEFDNTTFIISGNLLDEDFNPILKEKIKYETCGGPPTTVYPNRDVKIEYLDACTNSWVPIGSTTSSFTDKYRFYDNFNDGDYKGWIVTGEVWSVTNGELNNSGIGDEKIQTNWNYWNGSSNGNNNLEVSIKLLSGNDVLIKVFDAFNEYYLQTNDTYNNLYFWVNGALKESVALTGINPNEWNTWRIKQNESYIEFYINDKKLIRYNGVPLMNFGRIQIKTLNTQALFDNVTIYDGSWSYYFGAACNVRKIRAVYMPSDWYYNYTSAEIDIDPMMFPCKLTVNTQIDVGETPLPDVEVNVSDGVINRKITKITAGPSAIAEFLLSATFLHIHNITVNNLFDSRSFSHFWDHDCDTMNVGYWLDTDDNPYWFSICRDKNITAQYKIFTKITDFNFDFSVSPTISGKLLDENDDSIIKQGHTQPTCTPPDGKIISVNRNVTLEYYKCYKGSCDWYHIGAVDSLDNGSWSLNWGCACNATKLRANYTPTNWYYMPNSTEISIICPCKLTVFTLLDITNNPVPNVQVTVDGITKSSSASGMVEFLINPRSYNISVEDPKGLRSFSHFWDHDCHPTNIEYYLDTKNNPYTFNMYDRDKEITAFYKTFTFIKDFNYDGSTISGKLLNEFNNALLAGPGNYHPICEDPSIINPVPVNRNVTLEYFDGTWHYIGVVDSLVDGSWSYPWSCIAGTTKLRANYTPTNWYYMLNSTEIPIACTGILDVYAFVSVNQVGATVAIGLGDVNWDGIVNDSDLWYYNGSNPNSCFGTKLGDPKWNLDCDMNLDNKIDIRDLVTVVGQYGKTIPIYRTHFTITLNIGTYALRAKYNNQIKNNLSVNIIAGKTTRVDFNFLSCDGFVALNCSVPPLAHTNDERLWGDNICGRVNAKIDCDGSYDSHRVCNPNNCVLIEPSINSCGVPASIKIGESFSIHVSGNCPADLPGKCLIECRVIHPDGHYIEIDSWDEDGTATLPSVTCNQAGNYIVDYCVIVTDFCINRCWGSFIDTDAIVSCTSPQCSDGIDNDGDGLNDTNDSGCHSDGNPNNPASYDPNDNDEIDYTLTFEAQVDVIGQLLQNVQVTVDGQTKTTDSNGIAKFMLSSGSHIISASPLVGTRQFSHFWDHDCDKNNLNWALDTAGSPFGIYNFEMYNRDRTITGWYKDFTKLTNIIDNFEDGDYISNPAWSLDCGGVPTAEMVAGYNSARALKITSTGGDGLACAITPYNAVQGRKITYACYGSRCLLGVFDGSKYINDNTCNLNTGECFSGGNLVGQTCGSNLAGWTICETTITETNPDANIWIYNDNQIGHWSVYDLIEEPGSFDYNGITIKGSLLDENNNPLLQRGNKHTACGASADTIPIDKDFKLEYYDGSWHTIGSPKFFDDFNDNNYNGWTGVGTWSVTNGELSDSGGGGVAEYINTNWNGWNSNNYVSVNIKLSGVDVWVKIFDGSNEYYFQTWNGYTDLHLYVNGVHTKFVALTGINPNEWNTWKIKQSGSTIEVYINDQKWMDYNSAPIITNGRIQLRTSNPTKAFFDDVNVDGIIYKKDGSFSYPWSCVSGTTKLRAKYTPTNWYYNYTSAEVGVSCLPSCENAGGACFTAPVCKSICLSSEFSSWDCLRGYDCAGSECCCFCY